MKLIREHINEKFIKNSDPVIDLGIGAIHQIKKAIQDLIEYNYMYLAIMYKIVISNDGKKITIELQPIPLNNNIVKITVKRAVNSTALKDWAILPEKIVTRNIHWKPPASAENYYIMKVKPEYQDIFKALNKKEYQLY
jgi:hypothetical protein